MSYKHYGERIIVQEIVEEKIGSIIVPQSAEGKSFRRGIVISAEPGYNYNMTSMRAIDAPEKTLVGRKLVYSVLGSIELEKGIFSVKEENVLAIIED
jgi:co-chaperonin GroES (HSP10)